LKRRGDSQILLDPLAQFEILKMHHLFDKGDFSQEKPLEKIFNNEEEHNEID
jgi:hypothetical protein